MSEEDKLIQQELVEEIMKAREQFPNAILYMETVMESYEELEQERNLYKSVIDEVRNFLYQSLDEAEDESQIMSTEEFYKKLFEILNKAKVGDSNE